MNVGHVGFPVDTDYGDGHSQMFMASKNGSMLKLILLTVHMKITSAATPAKPVAPFGFHALHALDSYLSQTSPFTLIKRQGR